MQSKSRLDGAPSILPDRDVAARLEEKLDDLRKELTALEVRLVDEPAPASASRAPVAWPADVDRMVRRPLGALMQAIERLAVGEHDVQRAKLVQEARGAGDALVRLFGDLRDAEAIRARRLAPCREAFSPARVAEERVDLARPGARRAGLVLALAVDPAAPKVLCADAGRYRRVVGALLDQVIESASGGKLDVHLARGEGSTALRTTFELKDSPTLALGGGCFGAFVQPVDVDWGQLERLAIARELVEAMGGRTGRGSEDEARLCLWFDLPVDPE